VVDPIGRKTGQAHDLHIMILRQDRPTLASVSGICFLLGGINSTATGSFCLNQPDEGVSSRPFPRCPTRPLFASIHRDIDPSRDAAVATRGLLELLARRGLDCRVLPAGCSPLWNLRRRFQADLKRGRLVLVIDLAVVGLRGTLMPTASSRAERLPGPRESGCSGPRKKQGRCVCCPRNSSPELL